MILGKEDEEEGLFRQSLGLITTTPIVRRNEEEEKREKEDLINSLRFEFTMSEERRDKSSQFVRDEQRSRQEG